MPMPFRVFRAFVRSLGPAFLLAVAFLGSAGSLLGQVTTGLGAHKGCPPSVPPGSAFQCTFTVHNEGNGAVTNLVVTNQVPFPGGPITPQNCNQGGIPVTSLGAFGTPTDTCTGTIDETAPACGPAPFDFNDQLVASATQGGFPVAATTANSTQILACTPTPTNTPTPTPTNTPTPTPTNTPTPTPTNTPTPTQVPTLSFPMMALLGLLLGGAGLFLARRQ